MPQKQQDPQLLKMLQSLIDESQITGLDNQPLAGRPQPRPPERVSPTGAAQSTSPTLSSDTGPTRDLGGTDALLDTLSALLLGNTQQGFIEQGQQDFPGLNPFSNRAQTQHLASTAAAAPIFGQTATSIGGGMVELLENLLQGTNTEQRPLAIEDTTLDFLANQLGASGEDPAMVVAKMNALQEQLARSSPEEQFAIQDQIAPIAGPLSRALVNPGTITTSPIQGLIAALLGQ